MVLLVSAGIKTAKNRLASSSNEKSPPVHLASADLTKKLNDIEV